MCQLSPKKAKYLKEKAKNLFLTPTVSKKAKFEKFGVKKANLVTLLENDN